MLFSIDVPPNPLLTVNETIVEEAPPETQRVLTWRDNPNNCNEAIEWIASEEPFYCILKPVQRVQTATTARVAQSPVRTAVRGSSAPSGWFPYRQCTWLVWTKRHVPAWNNADSWLWQAKRDGYATGSEPRAGAIAWRSGHVAYINSVSGNTMNITEANYDRRGSIRTITIPVSDYSAFIY